MTTEAYIVSAIVGCLGTLCGLVIGYYKSKAELPSLVDKRVKAQCEACGLKKEVADMGDDMKTVVQDLKRGSQMFNMIKSDMAVIKIKLGIKSDIAELRQAIVTLEKKPAQNE